MVPGTTGACRALAASSARCPQSRHVPIPACGVEALSRRYREETHPWSSIGVFTFDGPGQPPRLNHVPRPEVPDSAALIRFDSCGVCGTDLHILKGHWPRPLPWPITLGHALAGVIEEIGPSLRCDFMGRR